MSTFLLVYRLGIVVLDISAKGSCLVALAWLLARVAYWSSSTNIATTIASAIHVQPHADVGYDCNCNPDVRHSGIGVSASW